MIGCIVHIKVKNVDASVISCFVLKKKKIIEYSVPRKGEKGKVKFHYQLTLFCSVFVPKGEKYYVKDYFSH